MTRVFQLERLYPPGQHVPNTGREGGRFLGPGAHGTVADTEEVYVCGHGILVGSIRNGEVFP